VVAVVVVVVGHVTPEAEHRPAVAHKHVVVVAAVPRQTAANPRLSITTRSSRCRTYQYCRSTVGVLYEYCIRSVWLRVCTSTASGIFVKK